VIKRCIIARDGVHPFSATNLGENTGKIYRALRTEDNLKEVAKQLVDKPVRLTHDETGLVVGKVVKAWIGDSDTENKVIWGDIETDHDLKGFELSLGSFAKNYKKNGYYKGKIYDLVQTIYDVDHVAIVPKGRCGPICKVIDNKDFIGDSMEKSHLCASCVAAIRDSLNELERNHNKNLVALTFMRDAIEEEEKKSKESEDEDEDKNKEKEVKDQYEEKEKSSEKDDDDEDEEGDKEKKDMKDAINALETRFSALESLIKDKLDETKKSITPVYDSAVLSGLGIKEKDAEKTVTHLIKNDPLISQLHNSGVTDFNVLLKTHAAQLKKQNDAADKEQKLLKNRDMNAKHDIFEVVRSKTF